MNRWDDDAIEYDEIDKIKDALIGREIISTVSEGADFNRVLSFVLDDGTILKAHAADGGCGCSNGCFTVNPGSVIRGTILNVELKEFQEDWSSSVKKSIEPGSADDGSGTIQVFVYTDLTDDPALLIESEGGDNGYYGWGFWLSVHNPEGASK